jgi:putative endonuclease
MEQVWYVYMLRCSDNTLYTGTTNNLEKRVETHNSSPAGAKYTKARRPVVLVYSEEVAGRGAALSREAALRKLTRSEKLALAKILDK